MLENLFTESFSEPAECLIKVDSTEITHLYPYVAEVQVSCNRRQGCTASLKFETRRDENGDWLVQDDDALLPWKEIEIIAAFGSSHEEQVMIGYIQKVDASYPEQQCSAQVTVTCRDRALLLDREHWRVSYGTEETPIGDSEILQTIIDTYPPLSLDANNGQGHSSLIQVSQNSSDATFLRSRAMANGYELLFEGDEVYFGPMRLDETDAQTMIMVYAGHATNCVNFNVSFDGHQPDTYAYEQASTEDNSITEGTAQSDLELMGTTSADSTNAGLVDYVSRVSRQGALSEAEMHAYAVGRANEAALKIKATGQLDGSLYGHVLRVGKPVKVDGVGSRNNGTYYVDSVTHSFKTEGYKQDFQLRRNAYGDDI